jgi:branched-chain amino acid transport system substrate-binding protein
MKKNFGYLIFGALVMIIGFAACSKKADSASSGKIEPIKIGMYGPLSGPSASVGTSGQAGVKVAIKEINAKGGVKGRPIELIEYDDQQNTETSVKVVTRLVQQDKVAAIIGSHISGSIFATTEITETAKIIQLGAGTSPIWTNQGFNYTFRGTARSDLFNKDTYEVMKRMGATRVAIISAETEYAQTGIENIVKMIDAEKKMQVVDKEGYTTGDTDFSGQIAKMLNAKPDAVIPYGGGEDLGKIVKQLRQKGYTGYIYGVESLADRQTLEVAGEYADDVFFSCAYFVPGSIEEALSPIEKHFLELHQQEYGKLPVSEVAYRDYDGMHILAAAMANAKDLSGDAIREAILKNKYTGIGGTFDFSDESGDGLFNSQTFVYSGGKAMLLEDYLKSKR